MSYCSWALHDELNKAYHNTEWGVPLKDDQKQFEFLSLEVMQCGLSWTLVLKKRAVLQACFDNFDYEKIAAYTEADVERILSAEGMIRSAAKIRAIIGNARQFIKIRSEFGSFPTIYGVIPAAKPFYTTSTAKVTSLPATACPIPSAAI